MISRIIGVVLLLSLGFAQEIVLRVVQEDHIQDHDIQIATLESVQQSLLNDLYVLGFPDAILTLDSSNSLGDTLFAHLEKGPQLHISAVHFPKLQNIGMRFWEREYFMRDTVLVFSNLKQAEANLSRQGLNPLQPRLISRDGAGSFHATYPHAVQPEIRLDGMAAFHQTERSDTLAWYGHINIMIPNILGSGKKFNFAWKRLRSNSESVSLGYEHPWVFNQPLTAMGAYSREVVDGLYQVITHAGVFDYRMDWERSIALLYERRFSLLTHAGAADHPEWETSDHRSLGFSFKHNQLAGSLTQGYALHSRLWQEMNNGPQAYRRFDLRLETRKQLLSRLSYRTRSQLVIQPGANITQRPGLSLAVGGTGSVRGYEENHARSVNLASVQQEIVYHVAGENLIFILYDLGLYGVSSDIQSIQGYGFGLQLPSANIPIVISLASHSGLSLKNSFVHIELKGRVPWIERF